MYKTTSFTAYKLTSTQIISDKVPFMNFYSYIYRNKYQI